jgi:hypothetical protein
MSILYQSFYSRDRIQSQRAENRVLFIPVRPTGLVVLLHVSTSAVLIHLFTVDVPARHYLTFLVSHRGLFAF